VVDPVCRFFPRDVHFRVGRDAHLQSV